MFFQMLLYVLYILHCTSLLEKILIPEAYLLHVFCLYSTVLILHNLTIERTLMKNYFLLRMSKEPFMNKLNIYCGESQTMSHEK